MGTLKMKKIISVVNQKGGVGKTTTSINFAFCLARQGQKVLLIDLDPQANSTSGLGIEPESYKLTINDVLLNKKNITEAILNTSEENLSFVPSNIRLDRAELQLSSELYRETILYKAIKKLAYDFIVIDCRPTLGTLTINALYASNFILVPCEMGRYALDGFFDLMERIETVKNIENGNKEELMRIVLTKFESRNTVSNDWVFEQLKPFEHLVSNVKIRKNEALNQAHMAQKSIFEYKPDCNGAQDYEQLTNELLKIWQKAQENN